ncbi:hypothetical protein GLOTRDRAFT_124573 [Gloeophyllum trabeum ATCC 11539]|uniref:Uncharacterized protein n=1 Tax=Gloeophyllum trabeum (strain ATCC 11539 / FP-39264 / Madison 617) TaxID=670483 RepID=S7QMN0_GLOTA|nr:uncharacterized protein GLOTRDRAFT_124573 [Gloeophyllum trabeum ATCC 11539]EPQ60826.1 hypothetical protein GLOTRDRAFT_124573 [Gloeophyllum trabeum ATCC 11539]
MFSWLVWDDPRLMASEVVTYLTSVWLQHVGPTSTGEDDREQNADISNSVIHSSFMEYPAAACGALLRISQQAIRQLSSSSSPCAVDLPALDVITKSAWAATLLLHSQEDPCALPFVDLGVSFLSLFVLLPDTSREIHARAFMVEALGMLEPKILDLAFKNVHVGALFDFNLRFDCVITTQRRLLEHGDLLDENAKDLCQRINLTLNFLAVLLRSLDVQSFGRQAVSSWLVAVTEHPLSTNAPNVASLAYLPSLLLVLSALRESNAGSEFEDLPNVWEGERLRALVFSVSRGNLLLASSVKLNALDNLTVVEIWDYARDALLAILMDEFLGDDVPLALLVGPCFAYLLMDLLDRTTSDIASPWNLNLCSELRALSLENASVNLGYRSILQTRLKIIGPALLEKMKAIVERVRPEEGSRSKPGMSRQLIFYRSGNTLHPICIPSDVAPGS